YSPLDQINTGNIKKLVPEWIFAGGVLGEQQMTPVVNSGAMFTTSTALGVNRVHALNAVTGELLWKHDRKIPEDVGALVRVIPHNRGVALHKDKVIFGTLDAHLVALDAKTGKPAWETKIADYADGYFVSQAPLVIKSKVIVGIAGPGEMGPRGFVEAFDAETGKSLWRWYSVPAAGEPGSETWQADTWKIGGGADRPTSRSSRPTSSGTCTRSTGSLGSSSRRFRSRSRSPGAVQIPSPARAWRIPGCGRRWAGLRWRSVRRCWARPAGNRRSTIRRPATSTFRPTSSACATRTWPI